MGSRKRPVWLGRRQQSELRQDFLGHAGEPGFSFKGDRNCWRVRKEGAHGVIYFYSILWLPSGKWGRGQGYLRNS